MAFTPLDAAYDAENAFAKIIRGELPVSRVFEDDRVMAIMPLQWDHPGHTLVIPKAPVRSLLNMSVEDMGHALHIARQVAVAQQRALGSTGFTILQNNGRDQAVGHVHFHVIPNTAPAPQRQIPRDQLDDFARRLAAAFPTDMAPPGCPKPSEVQ